MATPNPECASFFDRQTRTSKAAVATLLSGLKELHLRSKPHHYADDSAGPKSSTLQKQQPHAPSGGGLVRRMNRPSSYSTGRPSSSNTGRPPSPNSTGRPSSASSSCSLGVTLAFMQEVARHMRPADSTVAQLAASLLDPASRRPINGGGGSSGNGALLSVPGLVHASYLGPPDCVVAYHPDMPYLELLQALEQYEEGEATPSGAARGPLRYWLPCFSCGHPDSKSQVRSTEGGGTGA